MLPRKVYSLAQKWNEHMPHGTPVSTVYMLHEVYDEAESPTDAGCAISLRRFTAWLDNMATKQITVPERISVPGSILLTFDDIFASAYRYALPELRKRELPYTVFIAPGLLGQTNYITEEELRSLASDPLCTIGAHSMRHELLRFQSDMTVRRELTDSQKYLEDIFAREIADFAFPYGSVYACSRSNIRQVADCGFQRGFSTLNRAVARTDLTAPWFLPRKNINDFILQRKGF